MKCPNKECTREREENINPFDTYNVYCENNRIVRRKRCYYCKCEFLTYEIIAKHGQIITVPPGKEGTVTIIY